jgi:NAD(P)-dependent dehydrogenase (short-subunit alcohol dehydrogenase family)
MRFLLAMFSLLNVNDYHSSGIGRSVAVLMAREGADVTIVYLPEEQVDAEDTKKMIEAENRACNLFVGDLTNYDTCQRAVDDHVKK